MTNSKTGFKEVYSDTVHGIMTKEQFEEMVCMTEEPCEDGTISQELKDFIAQ